MDGSVERHNPCRSAEGGRQRAASGGVQLLCICLILQYISSARRVTEPSAPPIHHAPSQNHQTSGMWPHHRSHINPQQPANTWCRPKSDNKIITVYQRSLLRPRDPLRDYRCTDWHYFPSQSFGIHSWIKYLHVSPSFFGLRFVLLPHVCMQ